MRARFLAVVLFLAGCVKTHAIPLGQQVARPPVAPDSVVIYRTPEQVPGKFVEIALVTADGGDVVGGNALLTALRKKAGALGANAILLVNSEAPTTAIVTGGSVPVATVESGSYVTKAVAIYITP